MITHSKKFVLLCLCLFILGIFTSACGGGGKSTPPNYPFIPVPTPSPTVSPTPTPEKYPLELSQTEFTVNVGATDNITVTLNGEDITQTATYTVDQEAIATVEQGLITGLSVGVATVTVHAENAIEDKTFTVNVIDPNLPTLEVEPSEVNLIIEETANVKVTLEGKDVTEDVTYESDDKSISTVEKGVVKAKYTGGTANITVSLEGANSATFKVNVTDDSEEVKLNEDVLNQLGYNRVGNDIYKNDEIVTNFEIPAIYFYEGKKYKIISIRKNYFNGSSLESITIPDSVITIEEEAFNDCSKLKNVTIGNSVTNIKYTTFYNCVSLENVIIGDGVRSIGHIAFSDCYKLKNVTIGDDILCIFPRAFYNCTNLTQLTTKNGTTISIPSSGVHTKNNVTFIDVKESSNIEEVTIPNGVTEIPKLAFDFNRSSLKSINIPDSVTNIELAAFLSCSLLTSVNFGENSNLTTIDIEAFNGCTNSNLSIDIPESVTSIGNNAFYNVNNINISEEQKTLTNYPWGAKKVNGVPVEE